MGCRSSSVEEFWKSLKAKGSAPSACRSDWNSWHVRDSSKPPGKIPAEPLRGTTEETRKPGTSIDRKDGIKDEGVSNNSTEVHLEEQSEIDSDGEGHFSGVQKHVNSLVDPSQGVRYAALLSLRRVLVRIPECERVVCHVQKSIVCDGEALSQIIEQVVAKPLLIRFSDPVEKCRQLSISIFICLLQVAADSIITLMPYIFPVISERLPLKALTTGSEVGYKAIIIEPSEEVRLLLVKLLHMILKHGSRLIHPFASDIASILMSVATDPYPDVLLETFATLETFGVLMGQKLKPVGRELISAVCQSLSHNQCRIRVASLHVIQRLVLCGAHESIYDLTAYRDPNLLPIRSFYHSDIKIQYFALLAADRSNTVREEFLKMISAWLIELPERREHEVRLLPYVLSALSDRNLEMREFAFDLMQRIGQQYESENENEVKDVKDYLPEDVENIKNSAGSLFDYPFKCRPCLGSRIMVRHCFGILLNAINADMQGWQSEPKELAAELLYLLLNFIEDNATMHLQALIVMLIRFVDDPIIEKKVEKCANTLGYFVSPSAYLAILLPRVTGEINPDTTVHDIARAVRILSWTMQGSRHSLITSHIPDICSGLTEHYVMTSIQEDINESIITVSEIMVKSWTDNCKNEVLPILWLLLNAAAAAVFCGKSSNQAELVLQSLAESSGYKSIENMMTMYTEPLLDIMALPQYWSLRSLDALIFCRLIEQSHVSPHRIVQRLIAFSQDVVQHAADDEIKTRCYCRALEDYYSRQEISRQ